MENKEKERLASRFSNPRHILAFDGSLKLVGIFYSYSSAERLIGIRHQVLLRCCTGETIASSGYYFRAVPEDVIVDVDDLNTLTLLEFDRQMGVDRKIYATRDMRRKQTILESQYSYRFQALAAKRSKKWKKKKSE